jgi:hypothetical protein
MAYYVTGCIAGVLDEDCRYETLDEAKAEQERLNKLDAENGSTGHYWIVCNESGRTVIDEDGVMYNE